MIHEDLIRRIALILEFMYSRFSDCILQIVIDINIPTTQSFLATPTTPLFLIVVFT